jgi:chromosome segregation ATPase
VDHAALPFADRPVAEGCVPLASRVRAREGAEGLVGRLLADTWLVDGIADAERLLATSHAGARMVTRRGEVLDSAGRVTVGTPTGSGSGEGLVARRAELASLVARLGTLAVEVELVEGEASARWSTRSTAATAATR